MSMFQTSCRYLEKNNKMQLLESNSVQILEMDSINFLLNFTKIMRGMIKNSKDKNLIMISIKRKILILQHMKSFNLIMMIKKNPILNTLLVNIQFLRKQLKILNNNM